MYTAALPANCSSRVSSVHSTLNDSGSSRLDRASIRAMAWPELTPGAVPPLIGAEAYMLYRVIMSGPLLSSTRATVPRGIILP